VSQSHQALWFDAVPLLVVATAYLGATAFLAPALRGKRRRSQLEPRLLAVFPAVGLAAAVYGIVLAVEREAPPGGIWLTLGLATAVGLPALLALKAARRSPSSTAEQEPESRTAASSPLAPSDDSVANSLAEALDRERFVARISARVRSELDIDELLRVAVEETGTCSARGPMSDPARSSRRHSDGAVAKSRIGAGECRAPPRRLQPRSEAPPNRGPRGRPEGAGARRCFARRTRHLADPGLARRPRRSDRDLRRADRSARAPPQHARTMGRRGDRADRGRGSRDRTGGAGGAAAPRERGADGPARVALSHRSTPR